MPDVCPVICKFIITDLLSCYSNAFRGCSTYKGQAFSTTLAKLEKFFLKCLKKGYWIGGVWLCKVCNSWPSVASGICILTNLLIATDRFLGLYSPLMRNRYADNKFHTYGFLIAVTVPSLIAGEANYSSSITEK